VKKIIRSVLSLLTVGIMLIVVSGCGSSVGVAESAIKLQAGKVITFSNNEAGGLENGWWDAEPAGNWSQSERPILNLEYDDAFIDGMNLTISMSGFVVENNPNVLVSIKANGEFAKEVKFDLYKTFENVSLDISKEVLSKNQGILTLTFEITNAAVPNEVGHNTDLRKLGIFIGQMIATPTP
jgi:hypothetical protein